MTKLNLGFEGSKLLRTKLNWKLMKLNAEVTKVGGKTIIAPWASNLMECALYKYTLLLFAGSNPMPSRDFTFLFITCKITATHNLDMYNNHTNSQQPHCGSIPFCSLHCQRTPTTSIFTTTRPTMLTELKPPLFPQGSSRYIRTIPPPLSHAQLPLPPRTAMHLMHMHHYMY